MVIARILIYIDTWLEEGYQAKKFYNQLEKLRFIFKVMNTNHM